MVRIAGFHPADPGSSPGMGIAFLAQLVERKTFNLVVVGSSPTEGKRVVTLSNSGEKVSLDKVK